MSTHPNAASETAIPCLSCALTGAQKDAFVEGSEAYRFLQWKYEFVRRRFNQLLDLLEGEVSAETREKLIQGLGCECAKTVPFIAENIGNLPGYWAELARRWGEKAEFDEANQLITLTTPERPCVCPLVIPQHTPATLCDCSLGWQKHAYETILGRPVEVTLVESALRGSTRCVFHIRLV